WVAQPKMDGVRVQLHFSDERLRNFTRHGTLHTSIMPLDLSTQLRESLSPDVVVEGEWIRHGSLKNTCWVFDLIAIGGKVLSQEPFSERYKLLQTFFKPQGPLVHLVPVIESAEEAIKSISEDREGIEGLVFR